MASANTTAQHKNPNTLYHDSEEKGKMNINTATFVMKNVLTRYDKQMEMQGYITTIAKGLNDENPTISARRKAVEILENIKIVYQKTVITNELYRDGNIEHIKKGFAIGTVSYTHLTFMTFNLFEIIIFNRYRTSILIERNSYCHSILLSLV